MNFTERIGTVTTHLGFGNVIHGMRDRKANAHLHLLGYGVNEAQNAHSTATAASGNISLMFTGSTRRSTGWPG